MHPILLKRIRVPEVWFGTFLFVFKVFTVGMTVLLFALYALQSQHHSGRHPGHAESELFVSSDFGVIVASVSSFYFIAAIVQVIGGVIQLLVYSRRAAIWSFVFSLIAFIVGMFLAVSASRWGSGKGFLRTSLPTTIALADARGHGESCCCGWSRPGGTQPRS